MKNAKNGNKSIKAITALRSEILHRFSPLKIVCNFSIKILNNLDAWECRSQFYDSNCNLIMGVTWLALQQVLGLQSTAFIRPSYLYSLFE